MIITGNVDNIHMFYFVFVGRYFDSDSRSFPFKVIESFETNEKIFGPVMEPTNSEIINLLHKNGIKY